MLVDNRLYAIAVFGGDNGQFGALLFQFGQYRYCLWIQHCIVVHIDVSLLGVFQLPRSQLGRVVNSSKNGERFL